MLNDSPVLEGGVAYAERTEAPDSASAPEAPASLASPIPANGSGVRCVRCGTESQAGDQCSVCGAFLAGNSARVTHGLYRYRQTAALPADLRVSVDEFRDALIADQGGLDELSAIRAGLCRVLVDCEVGRRLLMTEVVKKGIDSKPGRAAYDRLLNTIDRWQRIAAMLGLSRRARPVSPSEALMREPKLS